jgi:putative transposase
MKFQLIDAKKAVAPVSRLCQCLGVSISGYYAWTARKPSLRQKTDMVLLAHIRSHFEASGETYGSPRLHAELKAHGVAAGRHRIARLMRDNDLKRQFSLILQVVIDAADRLPNFEVAPL